MTKTRRLQRSLPILVVTVMLTLVAAMLSWYLAQEIKVSRNRFKIEVELYAQAFHQQIDANLLRLKDAMGFVLAGKGNDIARDMADLGGQPTSITELGYFTLSGLAFHASHRTPLAVERVMGESVVFDNPSYGDATKIGARLMQNPGETVALSPTMWRNVMPHLSADHIVIAQALPTGEGNRLVVYAAIDMRLAALQVQSGLLVNAGLTRLELNSDNAEVTLNFDPPPQNLDRLFGVTFGDAEVHVTPNFTVTATLRSYMEGLFSVIVMIAGVLLIGLAGLTMVLFYARMQSRADAAMKKALKKAEQASDAKSVFLANMSHEIRTPLNGALGMAELLTRTDLTESQRRYAEQIKSSGHTLLAILNDILDISKLESGELAIDPVRTSLNHLITDIVRFYAPSAQHKGLGFLLDLDPNLPAVVEVDPTRLRQVLGNLISNALKFTNHGNIIVRARSVWDEETGEKRIYFAIEDCGIGIAPENIHKLFSRFSQAEESTTRRFGGTGLGLNISKQIVELMNGSIGVESTVGEGSTFHFELPLTELEGPLVTEGAGRRVALIASDPDVTLIVESNLENRGIEVVTFAPHVRTLRLIAEEHELEPFDAILLDDKPNIQDAVTLAERMKRSGALVDVPTIVLGSQEACEDYLKFDMAVVKPFNGHALVYKIIRIARSDSDDSEAEMAAIPSAPTGPLYEGRRALLVDDNNVNLMFGSEILSDLGFEVTQANNGLRAVEAAATGDFDVILMDCQMPVMDGYKATGEIRAAMDRGDVRRVRIIALTANALKGDREKCLAAGMDDFLTKPLILRDLERVLGDIEGLRRDPAAEHAAARAQRQAATPQPQAAPAQATRPQAAPAKTAPAKATAAKAAAVKAAPAAGRAAPQAPQGAPGSASNASTGAARAQREAAPSAGAAAPAPARKAAPTSAAQANAAPAAQAAQPAAAGSPQAAKGPKAKMAALAAKVAAAKADAAASAAKPAPAQPAGAQPAPAQPAQPAAAKPAVATAAKPAAAPAKAATRNAAPAQASAPASTPAARAPAAAPPAAAPAASAKRPPAANAAPAPAAAPSGTPAAAAKPKVPVLDLAIFEETRRSMKKFQTLLDFYKSDTEAYLETITQALAEGKIEDAVMPAHTIKSSSRIIGASGLALLAERFETSARRDTPPVAELNALRQHMERIFAMTLTAIAKQMPPETNTASDAA
ncbi:multi-sensor hybrid histidine kinase [Stappia sp. 22II-S9-Z10]|nr:multi-sensor hybrid histidine kinase [Stappia sp. 22II-S9-Z10]